MVIKLRMTLPLRMVRNVCVPGEYEGRPLTNWWRLIGDFDGAMREDYGLVSKP